MLEGVGDRRVGLEVLQQMDPSDVVPADERAGVFGASSAALMSLLRILWAAARTAIDGHIKSSSNNH